jgi:cell division protein FtsW
MSVKKHFKGDPVIWAVIFLLSVFSLLAVYSSTGSLAYLYQGGNTSYYILKHATILAMGLLLTYIVHLIPYKYFSRTAQLLLIMAIPLLLITLVYGITLNQASRWLTIPGLGLTFQTSDIAKIAVIMYTARVLAINQDNIRDYKKAFRPIMIALLSVCILIVPANFSTAFLIFATAFILMFIGRIRLLYLLGFTGIAAVVFGAFIWIAMASDWEGRIGTWKNRVENFISGDNEDNYQVSQAKIAIVSGGFVKLRPGKSIQRNFLPHPYSDFIYAIIIEEYGFAGGAVVLFLYLWLLFRAVVLVRKCSRTFPAFLVMGLSLLICFQALINMAVVVNLIPVTGQTLPMISMGGSSLLFTCTAFGMILSVSREVNNRKPENDHNPDKEEDDNEDNN